MGRLSAEYFKGMDDIRRNGLDKGQACCDSGKPPQLNREDVNSILKEAFLAFCSAAHAPHPGQLGGLEEFYIGQLRGIII
jgi:hypothetical protein